MGHIFLWIIEPGIYRSIPSITLQIITFQVQEIAEQDNYYRLFPGYNQTLTVILRLCREITSLVPLNSP